VVLPPDFAMGVTCNRWLSKRARQMRKIDRELLRKQSG